MDPKDIANRLRDLSEFPILFAVESGSRAWGIESVNSDYDVRFVYYRPREEYLKLFNVGKDTQELMDYDVDPPQDFVGWDIFKYLRLLGNSNPSAIEWLHSSIIYIDHPIKNKLRDLMNSFSRYTLFMHYNSLAYGNYRKYIENISEPPAKKFLYVLRGQLSAIYIAEKDLFPPLDFLSMVNLLKDTSWGIDTISEPVERLVAHKKEGKEMDGYRVGADLLFWIPDTFDRLTELEATLKELDTNSPSHEQLENILVEVLDARE